MNTHTLKQLLKSSHVPLSGLLILAAVVALQYIIGSESLLLLPFFMGTSAGACDCGGNGGGSSDCSCNCGSNSVGCAGGECSSGCSESSTPYLSIKESDGSYRLLNDVMIGTPLTYVADKASGEMLLTEAENGWDLYPITLDTVDQSKPLQLRLKEIEPEESYIYELRAQLFSLEASEELLQEWSHRSLFKVTTADIHPITGAVRKGNGDDCSRFLNHSMPVNYQNKQQHSVRLLKGETLEFVLEKNQQAKTTHLVIGSFWRDWIAGMTPDEIHAQNNIAKKEGVAGSPYRRYPVGRVTAKISAAVAVITGLFFGTPATQPQAPSDNPLVAFMQKCNSVQTAHADAPHGNSLNISYRDAVTGSWVHFATIQPRAYAPHKVLVTLPDEAFAENGIAALQILATQQHYVKSIETIAGEVTPAQREVEQDFREELKTDRSVIQYPNTDNVRHLVAGDTLELSLNTKGQHYTHMALAIRGFYTPLTPASRVAAGDWRAKRTPYEQELMTALYGK